MTSQAFQINRSSNYLIMNNQAGGGHRSVVEFYSKKVREHGGKFIVKDILKDSLGERISSSLYDYWNNAFKTERFEDLEIPIKLRGLGEIGLFLPEYINVSMWLQSMKINDIINPQPAGLPGLISSVRTINYINEKILKNDRKITIYNIITELPTSQTSDFFDSYKNLSEEDRKICKIVTTKPLLEGTDCSSDEEFWKKYTGFDISNVIYEDLPIRKPFVEQSKINPDDITELNINIKVKNEKKVKELLKDISALPNEVQSNNNTIEITSDDLVSSIMLGSQASQSTLNYVEQLVPFLKKNNDGKNQFVFVFCGDYAEKKKENDKECLFAEVCNLVKKLKNDRQIPDNLFIIPVENQSAELIAPILRRSNFTITRSGGLTAMELYQISSGQIYIHSNHEDPVKGMPEWEAGNFEYLKAEKGAQLITTEKNPFLPPNKVEVDASIENLNLISQSLHSRPEAFYVHKSELENQGDEAPTCTITTIKTHFFITELFLRAKHYFWGGGEEYRKELKDAIESSAEIVSANDLESEKHFLTAQKFNHFRKMQNDDSLKEEVPLFSELNLATTISHPSTQAVKIDASNINSGESVADIPEEQEPHVVEKGWWIFKHNEYYYNQNSYETSSVFDAVVISLKTQLERFISLIGRIVETVAEIFGWEVTIFKQFHYFRNGEKDSDIYANHSIWRNEENADSPPSSYRIGHGSCLINVPLTDENGGDPIRLNIITDPVESDLSSILYPRMSDPGRRVEECPIPHVFMLSHNQLDTYEKETLEKLKKYQPIMLVPQEDKEKFTKLGFKNVYENNWWKEITLPIEQGDRKGVLRITTVPANHGSGQSLFEDHSSAAVGYVIHQEAGDIYFAGDSAPLSDDHIQTLVDKFNITNMYQPGDESTANGLYMHFGLLLMNLYKKDGFTKKADFIDEAKNLRNLYIHNKTYKLGNVHFDDTETSVELITTAFRNFAVKPLNDDNFKEFNLKDYEYDAFKKILAVNDLLDFDGEKMTHEEIADILEAGIVIPKIGSRTELA